MPYPIGVNTAVKRCSKLLTERR